MTERSSTLGRRLVPRRIKAVPRRVRELASIAHALVSTSHPYMAHIVPMRRCNLSCTYCNEFDDVSEPVPLPEMLRRIDDLARLGTSV
ncbi:MAG: radical SAM protein, partial [Acidobacteriaceae bacterium]